MDKNKELEKILELSKESDNYFQIKQIVYELTSKEKSSITEDELMDLKGYLKEKLEILTYGTCEISIAATNDYDKLHPITIGKYFVEWKKMIEEGDEKVSFSDFMSNYAYNLTDDVEIEKYDLFKKLEKALKEADEKIQESYVAYMKMNMNSEEEWEREDLTLQLAGFKGVNVNWKSFIGNYKMNLMFATEKEQLFDMGSISAVTNPDLSDIGSALESKRTFKAYADNTLTYLLHQQGYTLSNLYDVLYSDIEDKNTNKFLLSVKEEIEDKTSWMSEFTILIELNQYNIEDVFEAIQTKEGYLIVNQDNEMGLFNEWDGSGSLLNIQPEKEVIMPMSMLRNAQIEGADNNSGYTINETYGLMDTCWKDNFNIVSDVKKENKEIKEDMDETHAKWMRLKKENEETNC